MSAIKTRIRIFLQQESGFTLTELMVTMMMMLIVMFALYSIFDMSIRVFSFGNDKTEAVENARLGLERIERELRAAYPYNKTDGDATNDNIFNGYSTTSALSPNSFNSITFYNDLNGNNVEDGSERITYNLSGASPPALLRNGDPVVEFVQPDGLTFTFCEVSTSCNPALPPSLTEGKAKLVRVELKVRVKRGSANAATQALRTDVTLRNRNR